MEKIITLTYTVLNPSETAEEEILKRAQEISEYILQIYGGKVSIEWTAKK